MAFKTIVIAFGCSVATGCGQPPRVDPCTVDAAPVTDPASLDASFFGINIGPPDDVPTVPFGALGHPAHLAWGWIERAGRGQYDFSDYDAWAKDAADHGTDVMVTFGWTPSWAVADQTTCKMGSGAFKFCSAPPDNLTDWTDFVTAVVQHFDGVGAPHVRYYELWNEANNPEFWTGTGGELVQMAQLAYPIIHQDPLSLLLTPSVTGAPSGSAKSEAEWMAAYLAGGGARYADGGTYHAYIGDPQVVTMPENADGCAGCAGSPVTKATAMRAVFDAGGLAGKPMFQSEGSWGNQEKMAWLDDPDTQIAWITHWFVLQAALHATTNLARTYWFTWGAKGTPGANGQLWGNIEDATGAPTAAGMAYARLFCILLGASFAAPCTKDATDGTWSCELTERDGERATIVWNDTPGTPYEAPPDVTRMEDFEGNTAAVSGTVSLGPKPIVLERPRCP